jgi:mycothione reductase
MAVLAKVIKLYFIHYCGIMDEYDVLVIGSGSGMLIVSAAADMGMKTALVEFGPMGGTCLNRGCIPSKMLIYPADVVKTIQAAEKFGINVKIDSIDFKKIMQRMRKLIAEDSEHETRAVESDPNVTWYKNTGEFVSDYTMKVGDQKIKGEKIFIVSGARPAVPPIKGFEKVDYLTSDTLLDLEERPNDIIVIGGGYVAVEYAHFFSSMGTKVTIVEKLPRPLSGEEPEISELLKEEMQKRMDVFLNCQVIEVSENKGIKTVMAKNLSDGEIRKFSAEALLVAVGRVPNSDILKPEKTGVKVDERGFIKVNEYLETSKKNIWAFGDAIGKKMFKHVANYEAGIAWHNAFHDHKVEMDYSAAPHAAFTHPQVASVGMGAAEAKQKGHKILVGRAFYKHTAMGAVMGEPRGFVKVIVEKETGKILGAHIIGPHASTLIQEMVNAMVSGDGTFLPITKAMHIHPAMPEVVQRAFDKLREE